jgi:hypothetical protein
VTVIRHWLVVRPDGTLDMIDSAAVADRLKGEGKRLLGPYVPAEQLQGAVNLDDEAVIERATRALCDEEWWEDDWMTAMNVVGIVFQAAKGGQ